MLFSFFFFSQSRDGSNGNSHDNYVYRTSWDDMPGAKADVSGAQPARRTGERMPSYPSLKRKGE